MKALNIVMPDILPKATDHIEEQIALVKELEDNGYTYRISDASILIRLSSRITVFFRGKRRKKKEGARVEVGTYKASCGRFCAVEVSPENTVRDMEWDSPWGVGFPGAGMRVHRHVDEVSRQSLRHSHGRD